MIIKCFKINIKHKETTHEAKIFINKNPKILIKGLLWIHLNVHVPYFNQIAFPRFQPDVKCINSLIQYVHVETLKFQLFEQQAPYINYKTKVEIRYSVFFQSSLTRYDFNQTFYHACTENVQKTNIVHTPHLCIRINNNLQIFTLHKNFRILLSAFQSQRIHDNSVQRPIGSDKNQLRPTLNDNREKMYPWDKDTRQMLGFPSDAGSRHI